MNSGHQNIRALIRPLRKAHLAQLMRRFAHLTDEDFVFDTEAIGRDSRGNVARADVLNLPYRSDFEIREHNDVFSVNLTENLSEDFDPTTLWLSEDQAITFRPFAWNALVIGFHMDGKVRQLQALRHWYLEWFQSRLFVDAPALCGTVHQITGPVKDDDFWTIKVDLGTAPEEAVVELLDALIACGVTNIEFRSAVGAEHEHQ